MNATARLSAPPRPFRPVHLPVLTAVHAREQVEALIAECVGELGSLVGGLRLRRGFSDGAWVVAFVSGGQWGGDTAFSRLEFEIRVEECGRTVALRAATTVRNRDVSRAELRFAGGSQGLTSARAIVEAACCAFVERWFDRTWGRAA